ncbi:hypothetical protein JCM19046_1932 [Bacillus sp. JCM 19046]|nr:hypothetical protein JCM19045_650 [Bacillus sp. JCM 19045]GAF17420.1 hypothetical protein JCM19046_1932 [Bacillus sp. JCM 19046]
MLLAAIVKSIPSTFGVFLFSLLFMALFFDAIHWERMIIFSIGFLFISTIYYFIRLTTMKRQLIDNNKDESA